MTGIKSVFNQGGFYSTHNRLSNCSLFLCTFDRCSITGNYHGGSICIKEARYIKLNSICVFKCSAYRCPGVLIWGHGSNVVESLNVNQTCENNQVTSEVCGGCYARETALLSNNNYSHFKSTVLGSGFFVGCGRSGVVAQFITMNSLEGMAFLCFWPYGPPEYNEAQYMNIVSTRTNYAVGIYMSFRCRLSYSTFINTTFNYACYKEVSSTLEFYKCFFENTNSIADFSSCSTLSCTIQSSNTLIIHKFLGTKICWESNQNVQHTFVSLYPISYYSHIWILLGIEI